MGYEPITHCTECNDTADVYMPSPWVCDSCDESATCPNCGGEGIIYSCQDEIACVDPEGGCDLCERRCDWCSAP